MSAHAANLAEIVAGSQHRLAAETRADAAMHSATCGCGDCGRRAAALAETRREAVADLERLRDALPACSTDRAEAEGQRHTLDERSGRAWGALMLEAWAAAWLAWALAADPVAGAAS